ncbi:MAG: AMP-binding protein [Syntrophaceae bacterium]|nr:AMP-binding protein [Syntrophaceae bacterium]
MIERKFWDEENETLPIQKLQKLQNERLQNAIDWAYKKTKFYRALFDQAEVKPQDISSIEDLSKIPFTTDIEVATDIPLKDRLAIPEEKIKMYHSTSGTVGSVVPIPFSEKDMETFFKDGEARSRWTMGVRPWDTIQILTRFDCCLLGYKKLGASIVLLSAGRYSTDHQIRLTKESGVTVIEHMPSLLLHYFERMEQIGIDIKDTELRMVSGVGEGWAESYKKKIEGKYGIPFMTLYGAVETVPFAAAECEARKGMHINADVGILEVVDPKTGKLLPEGEEGELVVTMFEREAMPLIRYRVGDVGSILPYEICSCGRTMPKMSYVKGRVSQIVNIRGKNILPIDVEEVIAGFEDLENEFRIICSKQEMEVLKLRIEHKSEVKQLKVLKEKVEEMFFNNLGINTELDLVPKGKLERVTFKAQRIEKLY